MKKHYPWLWFDADGTLFDYQQAENKALEQTLQTFEIPFNDTVMNTYRRLNRQLWQALERQEITPEALQVRRFELLLDALQQPHSPSQVGEAFLGQLAQCAELIDGAYDVLNTLHATSRIAIVTNGFKTVQDGRLARSPIREFVTEIIISEEVGAAKPHAAFFDAAFARTGNPARRDVLVIGDSLTSDMQGGVDYGLDTCWFNPSGVPRPAGLPITHEIGALQELLRMVA